MSDDLRSTIEAAASTAPTEVSSATAAPPVQVETPAPASTPAPVSSEGSAVVTGSESDSSVPVEARTTPRDDTPPSIEEVVGAEHSTPADKAETPEQREARHRVDRAPQSWKGDAKKLWEQLPLQVRQEVARRERDINTRLQESAQDRQKVQAITEVLTPHRDRIMASYGSPMNAIGSLLQTEAVLHGGTQMQKAQMVAQIIQNFGIDIRTLDSVLAGQPAPEHVQQQSAIEQLLEQKLAPLQQFIQAQQQREAQTRQKTAEQAAMTVEQMAADPAYPYFQDVREDMADIIELSTRKGIYISLPEAYNKAVRMNDGAYKASTVRDSVQGDQQAALDAHRAAQAAKGASVSVSGSPAMGGKQQLASSTDLRGTIAAALDGGRL